MICHRYRKRDTEISHPTRVKSPHPDSEPNHALGLFFSCSLVPEEVEPAPSSNDLHTLSFTDSTNTSNGHSSKVDHFSLPTLKSSFIPSSTSLTSLPSSSHPPAGNHVYTNENVSSNFWTANPIGFVHEQIQEEIDTNAKASAPPTINDAFDSNLSALVQSSNPTNPFSPYGYSMAAQAQSPNTNHRQPTIFTPKRGTNPFDDDLIRR